MANASSFPKSKLRQKFKNSLTINEHLDQLDKPIWSHANIYFYIIIIMYFYMSSEVFQAV